MKKIRHKLLLFFGLLILTASAFAVSPEAEYGKLSKTWTWYADGSQEYHRYMELTLFTHTAMNSTYGESFIVYNPDYQKVIIHSAYTRQKDGTIIKAPDNAFVEVLPRFAADAPAYNGLKEMVVVHTGLELGATIYLDYSILTKPGYYPALDIDERLQETSPVREYTVNLFTPMDKPIRWRIYGSDAKVSETTAEGTRKLQWTLRNVPAASREPFQPQNQDGTPRLVASGYASLKDALTLLAERFEASVSYESETFGPYLTEKAANDEEKARILQEHVARNMGYSAVSLIHTGFTLRDVDEALRSDYGTLAEKTQLLNAMLNAAGIPSEVVAVYPGYPDSEVLGLTAIKDLAVKATIDGQTRFLSAVSLSPASLTRRGELDKVYALDGTSINVKAEPFIVKEDIAVSVSAAEAKNGFVVLTLPAAAKGLDTWGMETLNSRRARPFELPASLKEEITYKLAVAEGLTLWTPMEETVVENPCGKVTRTITAEGDGIRMTRRVELDKLQYSPAEYPTLRELINEWTDPNNRVLLFSLPEI